MRFSNDPVIPADRRPGASGMAARVRACRNLALAAAAALLLGAAPALAQNAYGINLSWNDCGAAGESLEFFACDTNAGASTLIVSVVFPEPLPQWNGAATTILMETSAEGVSPWWRFGTGECRQGSLTASFDFTSGPGACGDPWGGAAAGGFNYATPYNGSTRRARLRGVCAVPGSVSVAQGVEYGVMKFRIDHQKSTGAGTCSGCDDKMCLYLQSVYFSQPASLEHDLTLYSPQWSQFANWRCNSFIVGGPNLCQFSCTAPAQTSTWGSIKSLYR